MPVANRVAAGGGDISTAFLGADEGSKSGNMYIVIRHLYGREKTRGGRYRLQAYVYIYIDFSFMKICLYIFI